jgi:hypothetical protein
MSLPSASTRIEANPEVRGEAATRLSRSLLFPITIGIAILRYRLYDSDIPINRISIYGILTIMLVLRGQKKINVSNPYFS